MLLRKVKHLNIERHGVKVGCKFVSPNIRKTMPYCVQACPKIVKIMFSYTLKGPCHFGYFDYDFVTRLRLPVCPLSN